MSTLVRMSGTFFLDGSGDLSDRVRYHIERVLLCKLADVHQRFKLQTNVNYLVDEPCE